MKLSARKPSDGSLVRDAPVFAGACFGSATLALMQFSKPFITLASIVVIVGLCVGVGLAFLLTCTGSACLLVQDKTKLTPDSFEECMTAGYPIMESYPRRCAVPGGETFTENVSSAGSQSSDDTQASVNIIVTSPLEGQLVGKSFKITGEARVFENTVRYRVSGENDAVLIDTYTTANSLDIGQFGPFEITVDASAVSGKEGVIEVFQDSAQDGSEIDKVTIHVRFAQ